MKKFIAGVVLTIIATMALTTGAFARNGGNGKYQSNSPEKSSSICAWSIYC